MNEPIVDGESMDSEFVDLEFKQRNHVDVETCPAVFGQIKYEFNAAYVWLRNP